MSDSFPARNCFVCAKGSDEADLGVCVIAIHTSAYSRHAIKLPELQVIDDAVCCRLCFNEGIRRKDSGAQDFVIRVPDGRSATHWFPLFLKSEEHWVRSPGKTLKRNTVKGQGKALNIQPRDVYLLLDGSGSMSGDRIKTCLASTKSLFDKNIITDLDTVSFGVFKESGVESVFGLTPVKGNRTELLNKIQKSNRASGSTPFYDAIAETAINAAKDCSKSKRIVIVALTDGEDNNSTRHGYSGALNSLKNLLAKTSNVQLMVITVGTLSNKPQIEGLVSVVPKGKLISAGSSLDSIEEAYETVGRILIQSTKGSGDKDVVGTQDLFMSAFSLIASGENGHYSDELLWRVACRLLNICVVNLSKGDKQLTIQGIRTYFDIQRTLYQMMLENPTIKSNLEETLKKFSDPNATSNRRRDVVPDLGEALQMLAVLPSVKWDTFRTVYVQEVFRRSAKYLKKPPADLSDQEKLKSFFQETKKGSGLCVSFRITSFNQAVLSVLENLDEAMKKYDTVGSYLTPSETLELKTRLDVILKMEEPEDCLRAFGVQCDDPKDILSYIEYGLAYAEEPTTPAKGTHTIQPTYNIRPAAIPLTDPNLPSSAQKQLPDWVIFDSHVDFTEKDGQVIFKPKVKNQWSGLHVSRDNKLYTLRFTPWSGCQKGTGQKNQGNMAIFRLTGNPPGLFEALPSAFPGYASSGKQHTPGAGYQDHPEGGLDLGFPFEINATPDNVSVSQHGRVKYSNFNFQGNLGFALKNGDLVVESVSQ